MWHSKHAVQCTCLHIELHCNNKGYMGWDKGRGRREGENGDKEENENQDILNRVLPHTDLHIVDVGRDTLKRIVSCATRRAHCAPSPRWRARDRVNIVSIFQFVI